MDQIAESRPTHQDERCDHPIWTQTHAGTARYTAWSGFIRNSFRAIPDHHDEKEVASEIGLMYRQLPAAREDKQTHHLDI